MKTKNENTTPWIATHLGTILGYELEERKISQKQFAEMIGMQKSHLNELIKGKRSMTKAVADKIEAALGITSISLVNMQTQYYYDIERINAPHSTIEHTPLTIFAISPRRSASTKTGLPEMG